MNDTMRQIAKKNGVTPQEIEREIKIAIKAAMNNRNSSPESKAIWDKLSPDGKEPTVEEFIMFCINQI